MTRKLASPMKWQQFTIVETRLRYDILDNMRYDRACPFEEQDALKLERFLCSPDDFELVRFVICRWSEDKNSLWTMARWGSILQPVDYADALQTERKLLERVP